MFRQRFLLFIVATGLTMSWGLAVTLWHGQLALGNDGYWPQRVALTIQNKSSQRIDGEPVEVPIAGLAGASVESLRVCRPDGIELLYESRNANKQSKRTGKLEASDKLIIPVECEATNSVTVFVYAGNNRAWAVPEFLKVGAVTNAINVQITAGAVEQLQLRRETIGKINVAPEWANRVEVLVRNLNEQPIRSGLVRVNLRSALARLGGISSNAQIRVLGGNEDQARGYRSGRGGDLLFPADIPARAERHMQVCFNASEQRNNDAALMDYEQLLASSSNLIPDGNFEAGDELPLFWRKPSGQVASGFSNDGRFGKRSLELTMATNSRAEWVGWHSREIPVQPGATYLLSGWLKAVGLKGSATIHAHFHTASGVLTKSGAMASTQPPASGDAEWLNSQAFLQAPADAATVQIHLTMNTAGTLRHDGIVLAQIVDSVIVAAHTPTGDAPRAAWHVWEVNPLVKVFPDTAPQPQVKGVTVELARNEYEPFQLALRGRFGAALKNVQISATVLKNGAGVSLPAVRIERVGYVPIDYPSAYYSTEVPDWCRKVARGAPRTDGWAGWWPDPLIPPASFNLDTNQTEAVWITCHAPKDAAPGEYQGELTLHAEGVSPSRLPIVAKVLPFGLPEQTQLRAILDFRFGPGGTFGSGAETKEQRKKWLRFLAEHRLGIDMLQPVPKFTYKGGKVTMDAAEFDEEAQYCLDELGMNVAYTPRFFYMFGWAYPPKKFFNLEPFTPEWTSAFQQCYRLFTEHLRAKGWHDKFIYYISDEPHFKHPYVVEQMQKLCRIIHEVDTKIPIYSSTWDHCAAWDDSLDLWGVGQFGCFPVSEMERLQKAGKQMLFTCDGQMATDTPLLATERLLPYYCFRYGVTGFEFWGVAWWTYDPWKIGWHKFIRQSNEGKKYYWVRYPDGDGYLTYPGKPVGVEGPVTTIRLEQVREGLEDYEAISLLARLVEKAKREQRSVAEGEAALKSARDLISIPNAGGLRSTEILPNPERVQQIRRAVNGAIVGLQRD